MRKNKGISLIVLIITIIVIIILATAILVSVISNNPIAEANKARYESDRDNMQAVFTNTVGKIMAENQGVVNVTAGQINTETADVNETTGTVAYTVDNAMVEENASGTIVFDKGTNTVTTYYTGKKLPIYAAGETKWYVDSDGVMSVEVAGVKYGSGEVASSGLIYTSLGNYEHQLSDGTIEAHDTDSGVCSLCGETVLEPGLYNNGTMTKSWDELINLTIETEEAIYDDNGAEIGYDTVTYKVLYIDGGILTSDYLGFLEGQNELPYVLSGKLIIDDSVTSIAQGLFEYCSLTSIVIPGSIKCLDSFCLSAAFNINEVIISEGVTTIGGTFQMCEVSNVSLPNSITNIQDGTFASCSNPVSIDYNGTKEEWNNIEFSENWNIYSPEITVHCTDGDIVIPAYTE